MSLSFCLSVWSPLPKVSWPAVSFTDHFVVVVGGLVVGAGGGLVAGPARRGRRWRGLAHVILHRFKSHTIAYCWNGAAAQHAIRIIDKQRSCQQTEKVREKEEKSDETKASQ